VAKARAAGKGRRCAASLGLRRTSGYLRSRMRGLSMRQNSALGPTGSAAGPEDHQALPRPRLYDPVRQWQRAPARARGRGFRMRPRRAQTRQRGRITQIDDISRVPRALAGFV